MEAPTTLADLSRVTSELIAAAAPGVVSVRSHRSLSSGFVWAPGLIVTAEEALAEEGEITVTLSGGEILAGVIVGRDPATDIAVLRVDRPGLAPLVVAKDPARSGALVLVLGAQDGDATVALGAVARVAGAWQSLRGGDIDARIELGLRLRRGADGAAVLDAKGQLLGMAASAPRQRTLVIPSATIARIVPILQGHGRIPRGYLGLGLQTVGLAGEQRTGAMVMSVDPRGPGAAAGLFQGDILLAWDGVALGGVRVLLRSLGPGSIGQAVTLTIQRGGETRSVQLTVGERPHA